jgi:hypothetical protein
VTAVLSVAVKDVIDTVNEEEVAGMVNAVTLGGVVSEVAGLLAASPGYVLAVISAMLVNPSPSESRASRIVLCALEVPKV